MTILSSINPLNGEVIGSVETTSPDEIPDLVARARTAQRPWAALGLEGRAELLGKAARRFVQESESLGRLMTEEMGKPLKEAIPEAGTIGTGLLGELKEIVEALKPETFQQGPLRSVVHHDPFGVCAAITPWNFPMAMPNWMVLPSLAAGNAVLFKPSEETPLCGQAYADILGEHIPPDVFTVVHGADEQGKALVQADVDLIAFTGSREVGKHILRSASGGLKRVILELGGKDPMIVLDDADLEEAAKFASWNGFRNAGQVCVSTERIYVHRDAADRFEALLVREAGEMIVGDGLEAQTTVGPMVNEGQRQHVLDQLSEAVKGGAKILTGGVDHSAPFIKPTVLADVAEDLSISRDETFGPVICVTRVASDDEAIDKANATPFGLGAVVFGKDPDRAEKVARRLTAGMIGINRACGGIKGTPWVGAGESGYGFHKGKDGHRQFTQTRVVSTSE
jgi:succinate-semialdehyde dehydrogenase/glutarate-semialdehyde dehydrogenase